MKKLALIAVSLFALTSCETWNDFASKGSTNTTAKTTKSTAKSATADTAKSKMSKTNAELLATMVEPTSSGQTITIKTDPADANCAIDRDGMTIERLNGKDKVGTFPKTGRDLLIRCLKSGYSEGTYLAKANWDGSYQHTVEIKLKTKPATSKKK